MRRTVAVIVVALFLLPIRFSSLNALQVPALPAPDLLFNMTLQNNTRVALTQSSITTPNVDLQLYGDGKDILVAVGKADHFPRLFFGFCDKPCGFTLHDRTKYFDLRGRAKIVFTTYVSGFHHVNPVIKTANGALLIGDQAEGSTADYHQYEILFRECKWHRLDPVRGVTMGIAETPDLSKVEEVGAFDIIPGSGQHDEGVRLIDLSPPPGGWVAVSSFELWGKAVPRSSN